MSDRLWMIDAAMSYHAEDGLFAFCPVELNEDGEIESVLTGLTMLSGEPPNGERCIGIFHPDGQEACDAFSETYDEQIRAALSLDRDPKSNEVGE